jgi:hypothetical protein
MRITPWIAACASWSLAQPAIAQDPRAANPERPTVATHAYAVAPGYVELEQGLAARGRSSLGEQTGWDLNLKIGLTPHLQLGLFGPAYLRTDAGTGVGDFGAALKVRGALSPAVAAAVVSAVSVPSGSETKGLGAGRALGSLVAVVSAELGGGLHFDANAGPTGIGAGKPQWFGSVGLSRGFGRLSVATELFGFANGGAGPAQSGVLGSVLVTLAAWAIVDVGGVLGLSATSPDQLFVGLTTNFGAIVHR